MLKRVLRHIFRPAKAFVRSFLLENGKPRNVLMLLVLLATTWLMSDIYHFNTLREIPIAVLDFDQSSLSRTIVRALDASTMISVGATPPVSISEAKRAMIKGEIAAVVLIPSDLSASLKSNRQAAVTVASDMSNILVGRNATNAISSVLGTVSAGVRINFIEKLGERKERALARAVPMVSEDNFLFNAAKSYAGYLVPGLMIFFAYVYLTLQLLRVVRSSDTAVEKTAAFMGVILHGMILGLFLLYVYLPNQGLRVHSDMGRVAGLLLTGFSVLTLMIIALRTVLRQDVLVMQISVLFAMLSLMLSGITWPTDMFPPLLRQASQLLPFTPMAHGLRILVHFPAHSGDLSSVYHLFFEQGCLFIAVILVGAAFRGLFRTLKRLSETNPDAGGACEIGGEA